MPMIYMPPEVAFEVRVQCTEEEIQRHCDAAPENDRRDFDNKGGLQIPIYHCYETGTNIHLRCWYTVDENEEEEEFDIRSIDGSTDNPCRSMRESDIQEYEDARLARHESILQRALDDGRVYFSCLELRTRDDEQIEDYLEALGGAQ